MFRLYDITIHSQLCCKLQNNNVLHCDAEVVFLLLCFDAYVLSKDKRFPSRNSSITTIQTTTKPRYCAQTLFTEMYKIFELRNIFFSECQYQTLTIDSYFRHLVLFGCATVSTANDATWSVNKHSGNIKLFFLKKYTHFFEKMYAKNSFLELTRFR